MIYETNYIMHYNKNHDKLVRFAKGTNSGFYSKSTAEKLNRIDKMVDIRSDKKIADKLSKVARDISIDNIKIRDDLIKRRDQAEKILNDILGRIGERDLGDYTSQARYEND